MRPKLVLAGALLAVTQVVHGAIPANTSSEGYTGLVVGLLLLIASIVGTIGAAARKAWASKVIGYTGAAVGLGFIAYHGTPVYSPVTNPYWNEPVGTAAWLGVAICVASGAWAAYEGLTAGEPTAAAT